MMPGIHPSESEPLLIERLASLNLDVVAESFTPRIIRDGFDATAPAIRRAMSVERQLLFLILHEYATALDFGQHLFLTPHVLRAAPSNHIPIAYLPYNVGTPVPFAERTIVASFRGAVGTDPSGVRARPCNRSGNEIVSSQRLALVKLRAQNANCSAWLPAGISGTTS